MSSDAVGYIYENVGIELVESPPVLWFVIADTAPTGSNATLYGTALKTKDTYGHTTKVFFGTQDDWDGISVIVPEHQIPSELPQTVAATNTGEEQTISPNEELTIEHDTIRITVPQPIDNVRIDYLRVQRDSDEPSFYESPAFAAIYENVGFILYSESLAIGTIYESVEATSAMVRDAIGYVYENIGYETPLSPDGIAYIYEYVI